MLIYSVKSYFDLQFYVSHQINFILIQSIKKFPSHIFFQLKAALIKITALIIFICIQNKKISNFKQSILIKIIG